MYKLLFAVCVAVIAMVVAWLGLQPLEKVALSLRLENGKSYRVWITSEREIEKPVMDDFPRGWDEIKRTEFSLEPDPDDSLAPGRYLMRGSGLSGGVPFMPAFSSRVDTTDTLAVRQHYLKQLPKLAAENISSLLVPLYFSNGISSLKRAASLVAQPFDETGSVDSTVSKIPRAHQVKFPFIMDRERQSAIIAEAVERMRSIYSNKPVAAGTSWKVVSGSLAGIPLKETIEVKVREQKGDEVVLELKSTAGTNGTPIIIDTCGIFMSIEFSANQSGVLEVDETTGLVEDGELEQRIEGVFRIDSLPGMEPPEEVPFAITGHFKLQLAEALFARVPPDRGVPVRSGIDSIGVKPPLPIMPPPAVEN